MKYRWSLAPAQPVLTAVLARELRISPLLGQCLLNRGLSEPEAIQAFLEPRLRQLADPFLLPNMAAAVDRLFRARAAGEKVVLFGDYDVDGVTSCTLLAEVLQRLGWTMECYLPHRLEEGYGLSRTGVANCLERTRPGLLLAVDCGSTSPDTVAWLRERGVDTIVLDHHQVSGAPPEACALVNPRLGSPEGRAFDELCSAGLAFKLAHALVKHGRSAGVAEAADFDLRPLLDLVALGTIADLVPLRDENRILVGAGMERLATTTRPGLIALKNAAGIKGKPNAYEVAFRLAPRLNAAGRLETAEDSLRLLQARTLAEAEPLAQKLEAQNRERQQIERSIAQEVIATVRGRFDPAKDHVIVEGRTPWHIGVVGIVASRVMQEFYRPTLILGGEGEEWRGSGRSIEGFDLAEALRQCDDLLVRHGGHAMAAGVTVRPQQVEALRARLNAVASRTLKPEQLQPWLRLDAEIDSSELTFDRLRELGRLEQTGIGNPPVHLVLRGVTHARPLQRMGADKKHAKLWVTDQRRVFEAVLWGAGDGPLPVGRFDLAFVPGVNEYAGSVSIQLKVLDWQPAGSSGVSYK